SSGGTTFVRDPNDLEVAGWLDWTPGMRLLRSSSELLAQLGALAMAGPSGDLPLRPREMRDRNRALVLDAVARLEPVTRAQLAARTGLTKSSVSSIVTELRSAGLVV